MRRIRFVAPSRVRGGKYSNEKKGELEAMREWIFCASVAHACAGCERERRGPFVVGVVVFGGGGAGGGDGGAVGAGSAASAL